MEESNLQRRKDDLRKKIADLNSSGGNELRRFGSWMPDLIKLIDEAHRKGKFHEKPIGPLGAHIKLCDSKWAVAIEKCIGVRFLSGFAINDHADEKVFESLVAQVCRQQHQRPMTIVSRFRNKQHDVPVNPFRAEHPTVLEVRRFEFEWLLNHTSTAKCSWCRDMVENEARHEGNFSSFFSFSAAPPPNDQYFPLSFGYLFLSGLLRDFTFVSSF